MTRRSQMITAILSTIAMIVLILDSKTAISGAAEGIEICIRTVIPSLLPFFVLSTMITNAVSGASIPLLSPIGRLCGMPRGGEVLLLIGLLGGYPVGAQSITEAYQNGHLTKEDAHRLLGFCSNAGPAFIFGIAGSLFSSRMMALLVWVVHIISALIVGFILPGKSIRLCGKNSNKSISLSHALAKSLRTMASVCGWIILFRILIAFLDRWFLWLLPENIRLLLIGLLELANGCHSMLQSQSEAARFILSTIILSFGGICVGMQTVSVTGTLGTGWYFPGKLLQAEISLVLSVLSLQITQNIFDFKVFLVLILCPCAVLSVSVFALRKKTVAFSEKRVYNG